MFFIRGRRTWRQTTFLVFCYIIYVNGEESNDTSSTTITTIATDNERRMKAVVINAFGPPSLLHVEDIPIPRISQEQLLVRVKAAAVNPIDSYMRSGRKVNSEFPIVLGKEISGFVEDINSSTECIFKKGDRVFCGVEYGGYAEYAAANISRCFPLPEEMSFSQGASLYLSYFSTFKALILRGNIRDSDAVLIQGGSGTLATAAVQMAKHIGATVVSAVGGEDYEKLLRRAGAHHVVYYHPTEDGYIREALQRVNKVGFNVILEIVGKVNLERDTRFLAEGGRIIALGNRVYVTVSAQQLQRRSPALHNVGMFEYNMDEDKQASEYIADGIQDGCVWPYVSKEFSIRQAPRAHKLIAFGRAASGKIVFVL